MSTFGRELGVGIASDFEVTDFIIPKNLDDNYMAITTAWNSQTKEGVTVRLFIPSKSYWDLDKTPPIILGKHTTEKKAAEFHEKTVKKIKGEDKYC